MFLGSEFFEEMALIIQDFSYINQIRGGLE